MIGFIHIPKCAGTSVRFALEACFPAERVLVCEANENLFYQPFEKLGEVDVLFGHVSGALLHSLRIRDYIVLLRDPIERCISQVQDWCGYHETHYDFDQTGWTKTVIRNDRDIYWNIESVLATMAGQKFLEISNAASYQLADDRYFRTLDASTDCLERAVVALCQSRCFGLIDHLDDFRVGLQTCTGKNTEILRKNSSARNSRDICSSLPMATRRKLESANQLDIELYKIARTMVGTQGWYQGQPLSGNIKHSGSVYCHHKPTDRRSLVRDSRSPRDLALRHSHVLVDIAELQANLDICGNILCQHPIWPHDLHTVCVLASTGGFVESVEAIMQDSDHPNSPIQPVVSGKEGALRIAILQARADKVETSAALNTAGRRLHPEGIVVILNAMAPKEVGKVPELVGELACHGVSPLLTIDRHLILTKRLGRALYAALVKAKLNDFLIMPSVYLGGDCLEMNSNCG
jgi:hypothetical protein